MKTSKTVNMNSFVYSLMHPDVIIGLCRDLGLLLNIDIIACSPSSQALSKVVQTNFS